MTDLAGWTIVSDDDNGSILVQSPQGHRRRIWRDETEEENATLLAKVNKQQEEIERLRKGIAAVRNLINESHGVYGLHLNGDIALWGELEHGGQFEEWLLDFNAAEEE